MSNIIIAVAGLIAFTGCEDIIDLELNNTEPRVIIEANLDATSQKIAVIVSKSNDFYEVAEQIKVSNAEVEFTNSQGEKHSLNLNDDGIYEAYDLGVAEGDEVSISVDVDGVQFNAGAQIPAEVILSAVDSMIFSLPFGPATEGESYQLISSWEDAIGTSNFYRLRSYTNDIYDSGNFSVIDDEGMDGKKMTQPIRERFEKGSKVTVELLSTDQGYYDYYLDLDGSQSEGLSSSIPYNPQSNFSNGALGYFGAYYTSSVTLQL